MAGAGRGSTGRGCKVQERGATLAFENNVFINCPFDADYKSLLRPMLFAIVYLGLQPRIALETMDAGQARMEKISTLIRESKFSIHDLSRMEAARAGELFRLNMAFELGIDFGCRYFGDETQAGKKALVLESQAHRYKAALSDLSGCDIESHGDLPYRVVTVVRNWLKNTCKIPAVGPARIWAEFTQFMADNYDALIADGFSKDDIEELPVGELIERMQAWMTVGR